jgi:fructokinase
MEEILIGEALIDLVRRPGLASQGFPGGCSMNTAVALGRLGHRPRLATWFAPDAHGQLIAAHCAASGVAILPGCDQASHTTVATALIDQAGHATYTFDIEWRLPPLPDPLPAGLIHVGSLGAVLEPGGPALLGLVEASRANHFVTFDPNCRPSIMGSAEQARATMERYVAAADLVKVSDEDLAWLYPGAPPAEQARRWAGLGPGVVVLTLGAQGCVGFTRQGAVVRAGADTSRPLADTVGAGDAFMAGLIDALNCPSLTASQAKARCGADGDDLGRWLARASVIAGLTVSRPGADPPWRHELAEAGQPPAPAG